MRSGRVIRKTLLTLSALGAFGAVVLYLLASLVPADYRPAQLGRAERDQATRQFYRRIVDFINEGEAIRPFTWTVDEHWLNRSLASMDEIAYQRGGRRGQVLAMLERALLAEPAVALHDGELCMMVRSVRYDKILSAKVRFEFDPGGRMQVRLTGTRIGCLPVPMFLVREEVAELKRSVLRRLAEGGDRADSAPIGPAAGHGVGGVLAAVVAAIDGRAIEPEITWRLHSRKRVRVDRIDIEEGRVSLHVVPAARPGAE